jgi:chromosomal replication initiator protein
VIGDANRLAHAAALAVAEMPGLAYNPLFICGPPGLGKTHLLHSIANYVTEHGDGLTVRYTTAEAFTDHFVGALHGGDRGLQGRLPRRRRPARRRRPVPAEQGRTEQEFFHTFNALHGAGAQLVLTSDRLPRDMARSRTACASASRPAWSPTSAARRRHAPDDPAQARPAGRARASTPTRSS